VPSLCKVHRWQKGVGKLGTFLLFKNLGRPILPVRSKKRVKLSALYKSLYNLRIPILGAEVTPHSFVERALASGRASHFRFHSLRR